MLSAPKNVPIEVIIVDNASIDNTKLVVKEYCDSEMPFVYQLIDQPHKGHMNARLLGISVSSFKYLVFCDDDNWLFNDYLLRAWEVFQKNNNLAILGGQSIPEFQSNQPPDWFDLIKGAYAVGKQYPQSSYVDFVWGAGFIIDKTAFTKLQNFGFTPLLSGRSENKLTSGDDAELCYVLRLHGYKIFYDENLKLKHYIVNSRLKKTYLIKLIKGFLIAENVLQPYKLFLDDSNFKKFSLNRQYWFNQGVLLFIKIFKEKFTILTLKSWIRRDIPRNFVYLLTLYWQIKLLKQYLFNFNKFYKNSIILKKYVDSIRTISQ